MTQLIDLTSINLLRVLLAQRGVPGSMRSDNGPEFIAEAKQIWIAAVGLKTAYITPGSPWEFGPALAAWPLTRAAHAPPSTQHLACGGVMN